MDSLVALTFFLVALLEIAVPLGAGYWLKKKFNLPWKIFGFGALFFVLVQILHIPLVLITQPTITAFFASDTFMLILVLGIYLGLLAGLFEEIGRFLVFKFFFARQKIELTKKNALMFGLGWGGIESILVGLLVFSSMLSYVTLTSISEQQTVDLYGSQLNETQLEQLKTQRNALLKLTPLDVSVGLLERLMTITLHIAFTLLVFSAVLFNKKLFLFLAILWHSLLDFLAVFVGQNYGVWPTEGILFVFFLIAVYYIKKQTEKDLFIS